MSLPKLAFLLLLAHVPQASAQQITGRFYPEKSEYLVGEPVIVVLEVVNRSAETIEFGESDCPWLNPHQFEVGNASPKKDVHLFGCADKPIGGSCLGSSREIPAGGKYQKRFLLQGDFELDSPGSYRASAKRQQEVRSKGEDEFGIDLNVDSGFDINLRVPKDGELEAAYQSLFDDLQSRDVMVQSFAASAVTQNPPQFSETAILALADDKLIAALSVEGLKRLATPKSRAKLVQLSSSSSAEYLRQPAIVALGEIGNPDDCRAMLDIANENKNYTQVEAYIAAGRICKEKAVSILSGLVPIADSQLSMGVAGGLGDSYSRSAVRPLINLLQSPDRNTRWSAADALATLTHRRSKQGIEDAESASRSYHEWLSWWSLDGNTAPIYRSDECTSPQPLS